VGRRRLPSQSLAESFEHARADYNAAKSSRHRRRRVGIALSGSHADYHYRSETHFLTLMEEARDMDRNDLVVGQMIDRAVTNTVQDGFRFDPDTGDEGLDRDLAARWTAWSEDPTACDVSAERTFCEMEYDVLRARFVDGDMLALGTEDGALHLIEAHRCRTPTRVKQANLVHGVEVDALRRPVNYWITRDDIDPFRATVKKDFDTYPAFQDGERVVFHIKNPKRVSQTRGVTVLAPVFDALSQFEDINFAKLVQQQIVSCFAIFRQQDFGGDPLGDRVGGERESETLSDGSVRTIEGIAPGMEIRGEPGERLEGFSPNIPNPEFFMHMKLILTLVGVNLGMPLVLVLLDASETNFSGWRGAVDQARLGFKKNQSLQRRQFNAQVYRWKLRQWMADDAALRSAERRADVRLFAHKWHPPTWPYIQPLQDASADLLRVRNALISPRRMHAERGREWAEVAREIVEDNGMAIRLAKQAAAGINAEAMDGQPVHWRELLSLPTPDGVSVKLDGGDAPQTGGNDAAA
jgi:lambda family phage portal protein